MYTPLTLRIVSSQSFADPPINALLRIVVIAVGPILLNAVILIVLFLVSLIGGPLLASCCANHGSVMAGIAHVGSVVGMVGFFEFLVCVPNAKIETDELTLGCFLVGARAVVHQSRRARYYRNDRYSTLYLQNLDFCVPVPRIQA